MLTIYSLVLCSIIVNIRVLNVNIRVLLYKYMFLNLQRFSVNFA